jgi:tryptophan-rich sensory protein
MTSGAIPSGPRRGGLPALAVFLALSFAVAAISGLTTAASVTTWYAALNKPAFNPPNWVFGPVWTVLYVLMAVAAWRVWLRPASRERRTALALYAVQLGLNFAWSLVFFGAHAPAAALADITALFAAVCSTALAFRRLSPAAALMLAPYSLWVAFAGALNFAIWRLN